MKHTMLSGDSIMPSRSAPGKKRRKAKSRKGIVHTTRRSALSIRISAGWKFLKRLAVDALVVIGFITVVVLAMRYWGGG